MSRPVVNPGRIIMSGDNHVARLRADPDGPDTALINYFRVEVSEHGSGHAAFILPRLAQPGGPNACFTDNRPLADWLIASYLMTMDRYKALPAMDGLAVVEGASFESQSELPAAWTERISGGGVDVSIRWRSDGSEPFFVEIVGQRSSTRTVEVFASVVQTDEVALHVDGRRVPGRMYDEENWGRPMKSGILAFAETWIEID